MALLFMTEEQFTSYCKGEISRGDLQTQHQERCLVGAFERLRHTKNTDIQTEGSKVVFRFFDW